MSCPVYFQINLSTHEGGVQPSLLNIVRYQSTSKCWKQITCLMIAKLIIPFCTIHVGSNLVSTWSENVVASSISERSKHDSSVWIINNSVSEFENSLVGYPKTWKGIYTIQKKIGWWTIILYPWAYYCLLCIFFSSLRSL